MDGLLSSLGKFNCNLFIMILHRNSKYKSITSFEDIDFRSDFVVITWVNWSGKSQLLEAIKNNDVSVVGFDNKEILYFDYRTFLLDNEGDFQYQHVMESKNQAWQKLKNEISPNLLSWKTSYLANGQYEVLQKIAEDIKKPLLYLTSQDLESQDQSLITNWNNFINTFNSTYKNRNNPQNVEIKNVINRQLWLDFLICDLDEGEFKLQYNSFEDKDGFLPRSIGKYMIAYKEKRFDNIAKETENSNHGSSYRILSLQEFEVLHWPKPWILMNEILDSFWNLERRIEFDENKVTYSNQFAYKLQLIHNSPTIQDKISFGDLSSGEKVLMSLVSCIYKSSIGWSFPDVLLLDEIDASLHPWMIENLFNVIKEVFIKQYNMKVIMVTHSPTSIAIAEEGFIYCVNKIGVWQNRIEKIDKDTALNILTEWYLAFPKDVQKVDILDEKVKLYVEGITDKSYIEKAIELKVEWYEIMHDIQIVDWGGEKVLSWQYKTLEWVLGIVNFHSLFRRIYLFDCDTGQSDIDANGIIFKRKLQKIEHCKIWKWIENLFLNDLLDKARCSQQTFFDITAEHIIQKSWNEVIVPESYSIPNNQKTNLCNRICSHASVEDFVNFKEIFSKVNFILSPRW